MLILVGLFPLKAQADGIVDRTATRDTLAIPFAALDSSGNSVDLMSGDSVYITVFSPGGTVVFKDSMAFNDASIVSYNWEDFTGGQHYAYVERVSILDGASTAEGVFSYVLAIDDNTGADLITIYTGQFQIINSTLEASLDSAGLSAVNSSKALDSLSIVLNSLYAVIDSLQNQDNWVAKEASLVTTAAIADAVWDEDSTGHYTSPQMAFVAGQTGASATDTANIKAMLTNNPSVAGGDALKPATIGRVLDVDVNNRAFVDVKAISADAAAADSLESSLEGYANTQLTSRELLFTNLDEVLSTRSKIGDTAAGGDIRDIAIAAMRDSLQFLITATGFSIHSVDDIWEYDSANVSGVQAIGSMLKDTSAYQGSAAGITEAGVADAVWDELQSAHTIAGSFGKYLDTEISGVSSGSGAFGYTIVTFDSANIQPVAGVALTVRNISQTGLIAVGSSDLNGRESFNLDADSFVVIATAPGFLFTSFDSIVVTGAGVDTVFGYTFNPGTPAPGLCRVFGYLLTISGAGEANAEVSAHLPKGVSRTGGAIVSPFSVRTSTDSTGFWAIDVVPTPLLNPATSMYEFLITRSDGTILRKRVTVPNQSSWQLTW